MDKSSSIPVQLAVPVGIASGEVLPANPERRALRGVNSSVNWIWLSLGDSQHPAIIGTGAYGLAPNGTFDILPIMLQDSSGAWYSYIYTGPIQAIAGGAASNLGLTEE